MRKRGMWVFGGVAILVLLARKGAQNSAGVLPRKQEDLPPLTAGDARALAQMLLAETDFRLTEPEMEQIVMVAMNRARKRSVSPSSVVTPPGSPQAWNPSALYRDRFNAAAWRQELPNAILFVWETVMHAPNRGFTGFVHPRGMPTPTGGVCSRPELTPKNTVAGSRCMPAWLAKGTDIGITRFA